MVWGFDPHHWWAKPYSVTLGMRMKLRIEPIPQSSWGTSLAALLPERDWDRIRKRVYRNAHYRCQICGAGKRTLHAHEVWRFDDRYATQTLVDIESACRLCHDVKHFGRSQAVYDGDYIKKLIHHWCRVNGKTRKQFAAYERRIHEMSKRRVGIVYAVKVGRRLLAK